MGDLMPRPRQVTVVTSNKVARQQREIVSAARTEQIAIAAIEQVTQAGMFSALRLKQMQQVFELQNPAAADVLNLIAMNGCMAIAQAVQRFGMDVG